MTSPSSSKSSPSGVTGKNSAVALTAGGKQIELGKYRINQLLGQGGFGITYLAQNIETGQEVVIKENLPTDFAHRDMSTLTIVPVNDDATENFKWAIDNFLKEAKLLLQLEHPNIVKVLDAFSALGTAYYVMPWVGGNELSHAAPSPSEITEAWLTPILKQLLGALQYLHAKNIQHRDIKPSNILMSESGEPVLIDFGAARSIISEKSATKIGSPGYTPIEQIQSKGKRGPWSDIYALGASCYRLITGERPPQCEDRIGEEDYYRPLAPRAELYNRFNRAFLETIDKALAVWGKNRWQSAEEWLAALAPLQTHISQPSATINISTTPTSITGSASPQAAPHTYASIPPQDKSSIFWKVAVIILLILLLAGGWYGYQAISALQAKAEAVAVHKAVEEAQAKTEEEAQAKAEAEAARKAEEEAQAKAEAEAARKAEEIKQREARLAEQARLAKQKEEELKEQERRLAEQKKRIEEQKRREAEKRKADMEKWLNLHLNNAGSNSLAFMQNYYESYVTDLKTGDVNSLRSMIEDHATYIKNWPTRRFELIDYKITGNIIEIRCSYYCTNTKGRTVSGYCKSTYRISSSGLVNGFSDHSSKHHLHPFEY